MYELLSAISLQFFVSIHASQLSELLKLLLPNWYLQIPHVLRKDSKDLCSIVMQV